MRRHSFVLLLACWSSTLSAQAQPVPVTNAKPGWQWSMDSVNAVVNEVRAGRSLQPAAWPNGARVAVLLSFDVDNENDRDPLWRADGRIARRDAVRSARRAATHRDAARQAQDPGVVLHSVGEPRHHAVDGDAHQEERSSRVRRAWLDSRAQHDAPRLASARCSTKAVAELTTLTGKKPTGYRAPSWNFSPNTLIILRDMGFRYESSLMADDRPYELMQRGQADRDGGAAGRVDSRRRAAVRSARRALHESARRRARVDGRIRQGVRGGDDVRAHDAPACLGTSLANRGARAAHRPHRIEGRGQGMVGDARRMRRSSCASLHSWANRELDEPPG